MSSSTSSSTTTHQYCPGCYQFTLQDSTNHKICSKCRSKSLRGNSPTFSYCLFCDQHMDKLLTKVFKYKDSPSECVCICCMAAKRHK